MFLVRLPGGNLQLITLGSARVNCVALPDAGQKKNQLALVIVSQVPFQG